MGTRLISKGADYRSAPLGLVPPVSRGLRYIDVFDAGDSAVGRNLALGGSVSSRVGAPITGENFATMGPADYVRPGVVLNAGWTYFVVATPLSEASGSCVVGNPGSFVPGVSGSTVGSTLLFMPGAPGDGKVNVIAYQGRSDSGSTTNGAVANLVSSASINTPVAAAARFVHTSGQVIVDNLTVGEALSETSALPAIYAGGLRIGSDASGFRNDEIMIHLVAIFDVALTDEELGTLYAWARGMFADLHGLTI